LGLLSSPRFVLPHDAFVNAIAATAIRFHATSPTGVATIYQRYDFAEERTRALEAWAEHLLTSNAGQHDQPLDTAMFVVVGADRTFIKNRPPK
jgi:hypothetical protein